MVDRCRLVSYMVPGFPRSLFDRIALVTDAELECVETMSGPAPGQDPFRDGHADLGWICSTSFVDLSMRLPDPSVQLVGVAWVPDDPDSAGRPVYFGDVVVAADSDIRTFEDLVGRRIGCNDVVSLSGHYALRLAMADRGIDPAAADLVFTGGHNTSLDLVATGELDAAVVDSVVRTTRARTDGGIAGLRIVERLGPWPVQPIVARADLAGGEVARVREALLASNDDPEMQAELAAASLLRFVEVGADHYEPVRRALAF